jgi:hypothetical protein
MTPDSFLLWSGRRFPEVYAAPSLMAAWHQLCVSAKVLGASGHPRDSTIYATALSLTRYNAGIPRVWIFDHSRLIRVYSLIGGLLDQLNEMAQDHRRWRSLGAVDTGESGFVLAKLHEMRGGLSNGLHDLQENVGQVLEKIDKYVDR